MEIWKDIKNTSYFVSSFGEVKDKNNKIIKQYSIRGYKYVNLFFNGKWKLFQVHRLVAMAFIPNPQNKREVDHINSVSFDNRVDNLRWTTPKENQNNDVSKQKHKKRVICLNNGKTYPSVCECAKENNVSKSGVSMVLTGKRGKIKGLWFEYF